MRLIYFFLISFVITTLVYGRGMDYYRGESSRSEVSIQATATSLPPTPPETPVASTTKTPLPTPTKATPSASLLSGNEGRIAFRSTQNKAWDIYAINPDGSGLVNMSDDPGRDWDFVWSPDGTRLAFISSRNDDDPEGCNMWCTTEIYTVNADGNELTRLTNVAAMNRSPAWSPDGKHIAFVSSRDEVDPSGCPFDCNFEIYVMDSDGSNQTRLTNNPYPDNWSTWSPDGTQLTFVSYQDGNPEIYMINADGSDVTRLTDNPANDFWPVWSPDGTRIAFISDRNYPDTECILEGCLYDIFVMVVPGTQPPTSAEIDLVNLHPTNSFFVNVFSVSWSPDSTKIVSHVVNDDNYDIFVVNADGSGHVELTHTPDNDLAPVWSPDGHRLAFTSDRDGNAEIYVMDAAGNNPVRLTNDPADDFLPIWSPPYGTPIIVAPPRPRIEPSPTALPEFTVEATPPSQYPGWKNFTDGNEILDVYVQGDILWAATNGGLVRWNLSQRSYVKYTSEHGLPGNLIKLVAMDHSNQLWIATDTDIYVGNVPTWVHPPGGNPQQLHRPNLLLQDRQGNSWVGAQHLSRFDGANWEQFDTLLPKITENFNSPQSIFEDSQGNIWVGAYQTLARYNGESWQIWTGDNGPGDVSIKSIAEESSGTLLLSTYDKILRFDPAKSTWEHFGLAEGLPDKATFNQVVIDHDGKIWANVGHQVEYAKATGRIQIPVYDLMAYDGTRWHAIPDVGPGNVTKIVPDGTGNLWVGTTEGLFQFDGVDWYIWKTSDGLRGNVLSSMAKTHTGQFWFGTSTGVSVFNPDTPIQPADPSAGQQPGDLKTEGTWQAIPNTHSYMRGAEVFIDRDDNIWVSSDESDVIWFDGETRHTFNQTDIISGNLSLVETIFQGNNGEMWFVSVFGNVTVYDGQGWQTISELDHPAQFIQDTPHRIWTLESPLGGSQIKRYRGDTWETVPGPAIRTPIKLVTDMAGGLWLLAAIDYRTQDLWRYDGSTWQPMPVPANGPDQPYNGLFFDSAGGMWLSSYQGLWRHDNNGWQKFGLADSGLASLQIREMLEDADGTLWIATTSGISQLSLSDQ